MPKTIILGFATTNRGKVDSASKSLKGMPIKIEWLNAEMDEPRGTLEEIARAKLEQAVEIANREGFEGDGVFVVDAGAFIAGLEWPGAFAKFELQNLGMERILRIVEAEGNMSLVFENVLAVKMNDGREKTFKQRHEGFFATTDTNEVMKLVRKSEEIGLKAWSEFHAVWVPHGFDRPWSMLSENEREYVRKRDGSVFRKMGEWVVRNYAME